MTGRSSLKKILFSAICLNILFLLQPLFGNQLIKKIGLVKKTESIKPKKTSLEKIQYIIHKYETTKFGKAHLFYPAKNPQRLVIVFAGASPAGKKGCYNLFSWYWQDDEIWTDTAYLFLRDDEKCWYLGNDEHDFVQSYSDLIKYYIKICKLTNDKVFTIGGSMGGYAAIFYATVLDLKAAIAVTPQANRASNNAWRFGIGNAGNKWRELDQVIRDSPTVPGVFLVYGHYPRDVAAGNCLIDVLKERNSVLVVRRHDSEEHGVTKYVLSKEFIANSIDFFEKQKPFALETKGIDINNEEDDFLMD